MKRAPLAAASQSCGWIAGSAIAGELHRCQLHGEGRRDPGQAVAWSNFVGPKEIMARSAPPLSANDSNWLMSMMAADHSRHRV